MSDTITKPEVGPPQLEHGDHERFAHIVDAKKLTDAYVFGTPLEALCGKVWVPSRDPKSFPLCPTCEQIAKDARGDDWDSDWSDKE